MQNVLSIRGGIRGIIPCCCLIQLEAQLDGLTREHIDYCVAASTGALFAAAVAAGLPASQLLTVYTQRSQEIFRPTGIAADGKRIIHGFMYDPQNLHNVLVSALSSAANGTVNDCPIGVMISATTDVTRVPAGTKLSYSKTSTQSWYAALAAPPLGTGFYPASSTAPNGLIQDIAWTISTLVDTCEDWVVSAISTPVQIGQKMAAAIDWKQILG